MNRQLHYLCAAFLGAGMLHITPPLCAQDEVNQGTDVTSQYLINPGFDLNSEGQEAQGGTTDVSEVYGWTLNLPNTPGESYFNCVWANSEYNIANNYGTTSPANGKAYLAMRKGWNGSAYAEATISTQTKAALPEGKYQISFQYKALDCYDNDDQTGQSATNLIFSVQAGENVIQSKTITENIANIKWSDAAKSYFTNTEWSTAVIDFTITTSSEITFSILERMKSARCTSIAIDNIQLTSYGIDKNELLTLITQAETLYGDGQGINASALQTVITAAKEVANNSDATQAAVNTAIESLATAIDAYQFANASTASPYDMTSYIQNPDFEENQGDRQQTIPGWTKTGNSNSEFCTRNDANERLTHGDGNVFFQYWISADKTLPDFSVTQEITDLPNGKYRVTAAGSFGGDGFYLVANDQQTAINTDNDYSVETTVLDGTLTLGVVMKEATSNFAKADHFRLYYLGYDATAAIAQLKETVDATAELAQSNMNAEIKKQLTEAVSAAQEIIDAGTGTDEQITAAGSALNEAITAATASAESYAALKTALDDANSKAESITTTEEAKKSFTDKITEITGKYNDGSIVDADIETTIAEVNSAYLALLTSQETPVDLTSLLVNPSFEEGDGWNNGWTIDRNTTGGADFALMEGQNPTEGAKIFNAWAQQINYIHVTQNITLPAGTYKLTGDVRSDRENTTAEGTRLVALVGEKTFESDLMQFINPTGNWKDKENWNNLSVTFFLQEEQEVTVGIYSKGQNRNGNTEGFFQADNMQLAYLGKEAIIEGESDLTVIGVTSANNLNEYLTPEVTSVDIRDAVITEGTLNPKNPNTVIYGPGDGGQVLELQEGYKFNAPEAVAANVAYTRSAFTNDESTKVNHKILRGWQTICLPFDVTEISANDMTLLPIMDATFNDGVDETGNAHPFWLYAIGDGGALAPATEIKANMPYLILVPNDPDFYAPFYNIPGDITFKGNAIAATDLRVQDGSAYNLLGYFGGTAENLPVQEGTTYYGLDAEGSAFVQTGFATIASFQAFATLTTTSQAAPQTLSIFDDGDGQLTALPNIREALGDRASGIQVYTADGGIRIESAKACSVTVYTVDGQALQTVALTAGGSEFVALPAGKYIVNGTVVIAQ